MKRYVSIIFLILLLGGLLCPMTARADVIYEPWDSFYEEHREECQYVSRSFTAKGPNGTVTIYESPVSAAVEAKLDNGEQVFVSYTYEDEAGILWGCCEERDTDLLGWAPMEYLEVVYDGISFAEEYGDQFVPEEGMLSDAYLGEIIYFWQYPGSSTHGWVELSEKDDAYRPEYNTVYIDTDGTRWGKCTYYRGWKGYWINLDDPTLEPPAPEPDEIVPRETTGETVAEIVPGGGNLKPVLILAIGAVVAITCLLIVKLKGKKE